MEKNTGKVREKSGNFVSPEKWEPCIKQLFQVLRCSTLLHVTCFRDRSLKNDQSFSVRDEFINLNIQTMLVFLFANRSLK